MNKEILIIVLTILLLPIWFPMFLIRFCFDRAEICMKILE
jgi:hypothetical protein